MILAEVTLGARHWLGGAALLVVAALVAVAWSYRRGGSRSWVRAVAAVLKGVGVVALAVCLVEPLFTGTRPRPGEQFVFSGGGQQPQLAVVGWRWGQGSRVGDVGTISGRVPVVDSAVAGF